MKKIDQDLINEVSQRAKESTRLRKNYNFHLSAEDPLHRMLNALEPETYVSLTCIKTRISEKHL